MPKMYTCREEQWLGNLDNQKQRKLMENEKKELYWVHTTLGTT